VHPDLTRIPHAGIRTHHSALALPALMVVVGLAIAGVVWWAMKLPNQKPQPLTPVSAVPAPPAQGAPAERSVPRPAPPAATGATAPNPALAQLALHVSEDSWIEVSDADGRHLLHGLVSGGSARELAGTPPLHVVLGKAPAVALALNGQRLDLEKLARRDGSARLIIDAAGQVSAAPARLAHGD
jgi:cytoskeletal protein RodZ